MKKKLNIIQFLPYFPPHKGGVEIVWEEIWEHWVKSWFWEVISIITSFEQEKRILKDKIIFKWEIVWYKRNWVQNLVVPSFEIVNNFPCYKLFNRRKKIIFKYLKYYISSENLLNKSSVLVLTHTRFFLPTFIWWKFARKNKLKWVHLEHWSDYVKLSSKFKSYVAYVYDRIIWKRIFKKADKLLAISEASKSFIEWILGKIEK
jgi:glycosyltransferase involved in cell wall biosynthesis